MSKKYIYSNINMSIYILLGMVLEKIKNIQSSSKHFKLYIIIININYTQVHTIHFVR